MTSYFLFTEILGYTFKWCGSKWKNCPGNPDAVSVAVGWGGNLNGENIVNS